MNTIVIVLGLFDTGLYTIRALARQNIKVFGLDYKIHQSGAYSKFGQKILCPNPTLQPIELVSLINSICDENDKAILIPSSDEFLSFLANNLENFSENILCVFPPKNLLLNILNKHSQFELVKSFYNNIPFYLEGNLHEIENIFAKISFPVLIKPVLIHEWKKIFKNKGTVVASIRELEEKLIEIQELDQKFMIQEIIPGDITNNFESSFYFNQYGECIQSFTIQKLRQWPLNFGSATMTVTVNNPEVEELSRNLMQSLNWRGFANVEFKFDIRDNNYKFIEINARVWQQISHAEALGINFPILMYNDCLGMNNIKEKSYKLNSKWVDLSSDPLAAYKALHNGNESLIDILRTYRNVDAFGLFAIDDIKPFLNSIGIIR